MSIDHTLNKMVCILRKNRVQTAQGGQTESFFLLAITNTRIRQAGSNDRTFADRDKARVSHIAYFKPEQDLKRDDEIESSGTMYKVLAVLPPSEAHHLRVTLEEDQVAENFGPFAYTTGYSKGYK